MTVRSGRAMSASAVFSVVDLPEPVGPVTSSGADGTLDQTLDLHLHRIREAEIGERRRRAELAEQAQHDAFAVNGRQNRHPHVDRAAGSGADREPSVLRTTALGDVEPGHHLDARDGGGGILRRQRRVLLDDAVHAEPDVVRVLGRDHMHIARLRRDGGAHDRIDRSNGGRVVRELALDEQLLGVERAAARELVEDLADVLVRGERHDHRAAGDPLQLGYGGGRRLGEGDVQHVLDQVERNRVQALEHLERRGAHGVRIEREKREVDVWKPVLRGERAAPDRDEAISHG